MKKTFLRSFYSERINTITILLFFILCCFSNEGYAGVTVTAASGGTSICSSKAVGGSAPGYTTLSPITITEGNNSDLLGPATNTLVLNAPAGWQFNPVLPSLGYTTGANIIAITGTITATTLTINITTNGMTTIDQFSITGLQVQATSTSAAAGTISTPSVPPGIAGITTFTNFASLSLTSPVTPTVTISASPVGPVCSGSTVTFTPTPVNGGASPAYQWYLNGTSIVTGATYINSSLSNGNTVYCVMTSTGTCITGTTATSNTLTMTVNPAPLAISGTTTTCVGGSTHLSDATSGGTWSSSDNTTAAVDAAGNVFGTGVGTATISYVASGCPALKMVTINNPPLAPVLSPTLTTMCSGNTTTISTAGTPAPATVLSQNFSSGLGSWTVDNTGSIGMVAGGEWKVCGDGYVNDQGLYHSPDNSSFAMSNADTSGSLSTTSSKLISPTFSLAAYSGATLTFQHAYAYWAAGDFNVNLDISTDGGGSWTPLKNYAGTSVGTKTGFVSESFSLNDYLGMSNLRIRYYYYCHWGYFWAIDNVLITGISSVVTPTWSPATYLFTDAGLTTPYIAGSPAATLYAHPPSIGTSGTVVYTVSASSSGCTSTSTSTVNFTPTPSSITGTMSVCVGATTTLSDVTAAGSWSSGNTGIATVGSGSGVVSGVSPGTVVITYMLGSGCVATAIVTVNVTPGTIFGSRNLCVGVSSSLSDVSPSGGRWSSSNTSLATIGSITGIINPIGTGTVSMVYTVTGGCLNSTIVTINPLPLGITGTPTVCVGATTALTDATTGGTWSSGTPGVAAVVPATGVVFGSAAGTTIITYMLGTGCIATAQVTVNPQLPITGTTNVCVGLTTNLTDGIAGGTWSCNDVSIATAGSGTGLILGVSSGVTTISYRLSTGCISTTSLTVNPLPAAITGTVTACVGLTTNLTDASTGGTWSSGNTSVATIGSLTGVVSGQSAGTSLITYTLPTGCLITRVVSVNPLPLSINGTLKVCDGLTTSLSDVTTGGTWTSDDVSIATVVPGSGLVTGVDQGTVEITYTLSTGCFNTAIVTVNPVPATITGSLNVCVGSTSNLTDATAGGTWLSSNTAVATIASSGVGVVTGMGAGTTRISYILPTGCMITTVVTVNPLPAAIFGTNVVCEGLTTTLTDASSGGTWSSGNSTIAAVVGSTGVVTGVTGGSTAIVYTLPTGCSTTRTFSVNSLPAAITGSTNICIGTITSLSDVTTGGTWSSSGISVGTVGSTSGAVTGISQGTVNITYMLGTGCIQATTVTVNPLPLAISGNTAICLGTTTTLTDATSGGTWSSSNTARASIGSISGLVSGLVAGTAIITYTSAAGCIATTGFSVNPLPVTITGPSVVCTGASINLSDASGGGSWTSGNVSVATVGSATGTVTGIIPGTAIITYTLPTGCTNAKTITVNQTPAAIAGTTFICQGATTALSDAYSGGTWSSSNSSVVSIGSGTGLATGFATGTSSITYTYPGGCTAATVVTVNLTPTAISGVFTACAGSSTTLTDASVGGTWSSSNTAVALIGSGTGTVSTLTPGSTNITYTLANGCSTSSVYTVNVMPAPIAGTLSVCSGFTTNLSDAVAGGSWTSSNASVASVGSSTGVVSGFGTSTAVITYGYPTGCFVSSVVTVNATPFPVSGASNICLGASVTMSDGPAGGSWTSSDILVATIGSSTGLVTTLAAGTTTIRYTFSTGCAASKTITVNLQPSAISGPNLVCVGTSTTLTDDMPDGTWTSSNSSIATIGSASGVLIGVGPGTATITYSLGAGCISAIVVTVNLLPSSVSGNLSVCAGSTTSLSDPFGGGGTWSSDNIPVATVGSSSGMVSGVATGTATITYTITAGCTLTAIVTVNPLPLTITESSLLCLGGITQMSDVTTGGTWSSSNTSTVFVGSSTGIAFGSATGTTTITYKLNTGCYTTLAITVYPLPVPISGLSTVCLGLSVTLSDLTTGGTWLSSAPSVASVGSASGIVSGLATGTAGISYVLSTGCSVATTVTVNPLPFSITGPGTVCAGLTIPLSDASPGGTWSSSNALVATAGVATGIITGVSAGTSMITYTLPTGCITTTVVTVYPLPAAISGNSNVCIGSTMTLSDASTGGLWSTSNTVVAIIGTSGLLSGMSAGTTNVTYTLPTGCIAARNITVNALPAAITGPQGVCIGLSITLSDATAGGTWSSGNTVVASAGTTTGIITGNTAGTTIITYTVPVPTGPGCTVVDTITVNPLPVAISGTRAVCSGASVTLTDASGTGTWSSSNATVATVGSATGLVTGYVAGTSIITYTLPPVVGAGCYTTAVVTVNPLPFGISGLLQVCAGYSITLSDASAGGTWSSSATSIAGIGSLTGVVNGLSTGTASITYTLPTSCSTSQIITVNPLPAAITGPSNVCQGLTITLSNGTAGGTWISSSPSIASVGSVSGIVLGQSAGTAFITYMLPTGCFLTTNVTVNPLPSPINGNLTFCVGLTSYLTDATPGGTWSSDNVSVATAGSMTGVISGISAGTAGITYMLATGCIATKVVTLNVLAPISGNTFVCSGYTSTLSDASGFGTWTTSDVAVAPIGFTTGVVTGSSAGTATISFVLSPGCVTSTVVTVNSLPSAILGNKSVCVGLTTSLSDASGSGVWTSGNLSVATIDVVTGIVNGVSAGTANITFTIGTGCTAFAIVTVNPLPTGIYGTREICFGSTTTLTDAVVGGTWSSSAPSIAGIGVSTGTMTGVLAGNATITYMLPTGCITTAAVTIDPLPAPITGTTSVCAGLTTSLGDATTGGTWSTLSGLISIDAGSGIVNGISAGTALVTYTLPTGCLTTTIVTVYPLPAGITGATAVCAGLSISLSDASAGGTWSAGSSAFLSVGPGTGIVTGISAGVGMITYTLPTGCITTWAVTVNPLPQSISGVKNVCAGLTTALSDTTTGGSWTVGTPAIATIDGTSGIVTGMAAGTTSVTYTLGTGCIMTAIVSVNPLPASIVGTTNVCAGLTITLSDFTPGGHWSSGDATVATVGSLTGVVTGVSAGSAIITYVLPTGCIITKAITVNPLPATITGTLSICASSSTTLSNATPDGVWSSGSLTVATIGGGTGTANGFIAGTSRITYTLPTGCLTTAVLTVNPLPAPISGVLKVCAGLTTNLASSTGGSWSSGSPSICIIGTSGGATGLVAGTSVIIYAYPTGCLVTAVVTVNPLPLGITGPDAVCTGTSITLTDVTPGGTWSITTSGGVASVGSSSGIVTGISSGSAIVTYTIATGCITTRSETVFATPSAITGTFAVCAGLTSALTDASGTGTWSSTNTAVATVGSTTGVVAAVSAGTSIITYALGTGCYTSSVITVNPLPAAISGPATICTGLSYSLSDLTDAGTWSSGNPSVATINVISGTLVGITTGTAIITYALPTGCITTRVITVNPSPGPITGVTNTCETANTVLYDTSAGGAWSSSDLAVATIGSGTGIVNGLSAGAVVITYTLPQGCIAVMPFTVNPLPSIISGNRSVCLGSTSTFTDTLTGGTWMSTAPGIASIDPSSGVATGNTLGTTTITYTLPTGCTTSAMITVNPYPAAILGASLVCQGYFIVLSDPTPGGNWSSADTSVATAGLLTGRVTGMAGGSTTISYTLPTGCAVTKTVTVNPLFPITGSTSLCVGSAYTYGDLAPGGTWTSNTPSVVTISGTGDAVAHSSGTTIISYSLPSGCSASLNVTVNLLPLSYNVLGGGNFCSGASGSTVQLNGSDTGVSYSVYRDVSLVSSQPGTGSALTFGPYAVTGVYTISAVNTHTGCRNNMAGSAVIGITPIVVPSVSVTTTLGGTVCAGANATFKALPLNGGGSPSYQWFVNGTPVGTFGPDSTYTYAAISGQVVSVTMLSNAVCAVPPTASGSFTVATTISLVPSLTISISPGDTVCAAMPVTITPSPVNGGSAPTYRWIKNGLDAGWGSTYNYLPANGDNIIGVLHSNYICLVTDTAYSSNNIHIAVLPALSPSVTITAHPGSTISAGQSDTLVATETNLTGATYQWKIDGVDIPGATNNVYISSDLANGDTVTCFVSGTNICGPASGTGGIIISVFNDAVKQIFGQASEIRLVPNPNNGTFTLSGNISSPGKSASMVITDVLGRTVYTREADIDNGIINQKIQIDNTVANGMYLLTLYRKDNIGRFTGENIVFHFVVRN